MADFPSSSLWLKLALLFSVLAFGHHLYAIDTPGWSTRSCQYNNNNNNGVECPGWYEGVEAMEVIAFLCLLLALVLMLCYVLIDEVNGNKIVLIIFIVAAFVGGKIVLFIYSFIFGGKKLICSPQEFRDLSQI